MAEDDLKKQVESLAKSVTQLAQLVGDKNGAATSEKPKAPPQTFDQFLQGVTNPKPVTASGVTGTGSFLGDIAATRAAAAYEDFTKGGGTAPISKEEFVAKYSSAFSIFGNNNNASSSLTGPSQPLDLGSALNVLGLGGSGIGGGLDIGSLTNPLGSGGIGDISSLFGGAMGGMGGIDAYINNIIGSDTLGLVNAADAVTQSLGPQLNAALGVNSTMPQISQILGGVKGLST